MIQPPHLLKLAFVALTAAPLLTVIAIMQTEPDLKRGLLFLGAGCFLFGLGETLNHPLQTGRNYTEKETSELKRFQHRRRNPCTLGNLLFIVGMLQFFMGLSSFITF